jgi:hypothetical protein
MYAFQVNTDDFDSLIIQLERVQVFDGLDDLMQRIAAILKEDNAAAVLAGTDRHGQPLAPLRPSTLERRKGDGPPLAPLGGGSRVATQYVTTHEINSENDQSVYAGWSMPDWLWAHLQGNESRNLAQRDIGGIRPATWDRITRAVDEWRDEWVARHFGSI